MLKYKGDIIAKLRNKGYSTYNIRQKKIMTEGQLQQIRNNKLLSHDALNQLCKLLNCQPGDILEYIPDDADTDNANSTNSTDD